MVRCVVCLVCRTIHVSVYGTLCGVCLWYVVCCVILYTCFLVVCFYTWYILLKKPRLFIHVITDVVEKSREPC